LRAAFSRWGQPRCLRVDNGKPWGSWSDLPPVLALWLIGLGIEVIWNPPRQPQYNGVVERSQGTAKRWSEPKTCMTVAELQQRLDADDRLQRERYPFQKGRSRWEVFPELEHSGRGYCKAEEAQRWDLDRALQHLANYAVPRQVDKWGKVSVYNRSHYVGTMHRGQTVYVMVDPQRREWLFAATDGRQLRTEPAVELTAERICTLTLNGNK
jgi:transposase InsO family protein